MDFMENMSKFFLNLSKMDRKLLEMALHFWNIYTHTDQDLMKFWNFLAHSPN